jgi:hypothetical protein
MENRRKTRAIQGDRPFLWEILVKNRSVWLKIGKFGIYWNKTMCFLAVPLTK